MNNKNIIFSITCVLFITILVNVSFFDRVRNLSNDILHVLRNQITQHIEYADESNVIVLAIDEETYRTKPFSLTPKVLWSREIAQIINSILISNAKVIGFDVIYPTSVSEYLPKFEKSFLLALRKGSKKQKIVLSKVQHSDKAILPHISQRFSVQSSKNIRAANVIEDLDGVIRRIPLFFNVQSQDSIQKETSLALELASRFDQTLLNADGSVSDTFGKIFKTELSENSLYINFDTRRGAIPTYSVADIFACVQAGKTDFLSRVFRNKIVLLGTVLDVEDQKLTSARFIDAASKEAVGDRCMLPANSKSKTLNVRDTVPGVYIHAHAINNILTGSPLSRLQPGLGYLLPLPILLLTIFMVFFLNPIWAAIGLMVLAIIWSGISVIAFSQNLLIPFLIPILGSVFVYISSSGYRFGISDRDKRFLRKTFELYLAPAVIDKLVGSDKAPVLDGENRTVTVLFSDLVGFTSISEGLSPKELVHFINEYLSEMTAIIEDHGGFVDKFIGDAIVAVFGAPHDDAEHADNAVRAALSSQRKLATMTILKEERVFSRIGVNTGNVYIGNIGSPRRFNYTVMGDAVNLAQRLEATNKTYGTSILISDSTLESCRKYFIVKEINSVRVVGRKELVRVYEPLGITEDISEVTRRNLNIYAEALTNFRSGQFHLAEQLFAELTVNGDKPSKVMAAYSRELIDNPPTGVWDGVVDGTDK